MPDKRGGAFYGGAPALLDRGRADLCQAFATVTCDNLVSKLERHGYDGWTSAGFP